MNEKDTRNSVPLTDDDLTGVTGGELGQTENDDTADLSPTDDPMGQTTVGEIGNFVIDPTGTGRYGYCAKCSALTLTSDLTCVGGFDKLCPDCADKVLFKRGSPKIPK